MRGKRTKFNFTCTARELSSILFLCITKTKITALPPSKHALKLSDIGTTLLSSNLPLAIFLFYTGVPLPLNWCVQPKESSGNEKEVYLVELDATSNEYNKVAEGIRKTASISITKIERVQNPDFTRHTWSKRSRWNKRMVPMKSCFSIVLLKEVVQALARLVLIEATVGKTVSHQSNTMRVKAW